MCQTATPTDRQRDLGCSHALLALRGPVYIVCVSYEMRQRGRCAVVNWGSPKKQVAMTGATSRPRHLFPLRVPCVYPYVGRASPWMSRTTTISSSTSASDQSLRFRARQPQDQPPHPLHPPLQHSMAAAAFKKYVAIVGSSGGGGASQAGADVYGLLIALRHELAACEVGLAMVQVRGSWRLGDRRERGRRREG